jgi:hypothetical protein
LAPRHTNARWKRRSFNIGQFLLEVGAGFAFVGRQVHLEVGGEDFYIDLLFYHLRLRAKRFIELKTTNFKPEHTGQLGFYLTAVDAQVKAPEDAPTIGLLLCKSKNRIVAESLCATNRPWVTPNTSSPKLCRRIWRPICRASSRSSASWVSHPKAARALGLRRS